MIEIAFAAADPWTNPMIVGLVVGIPTTYLGYKAYRRAEKGDKVAALAALKTAEGDAVRRAIDGLERLVENLQEDNKDARLIAVDLRDRLKACNTAYDELKRTIP